MTRQRIGDKTCGLLQVTSQWRIQHTSKVWLVFPALNVVALYKSLIKKLHVYMLLKEHFRFVTTLFKMRLNEYFLNSWHRNCETSMKMYWKSSKKFKKSIEKFKCSCNLCVPIVDNNLEIIYVHSFLDLGNKISVGTPFIDIVFSLQKLPSRFFVFATHKIL